MYECFNSVHCLIRWPRNVLDISVPCMWSPLSVHNPTRQTSLTNCFYLNYSISPKICTGFCFTVLCCGYTLTDFPISIRLTSLALWQSHDCPSAGKATLMNMDKYFMWIHYERLHNHNKAKHNKTVCIFLGIYCSIGAWISICTHVWQCDVITRSCPIFSGGLVTTALDLGRECVMSFHLIYR